MTEPELPEEYLQQSTVVEDQAKAFEMARASAFAEETAVAEAREGGKIGEAISRNLFTHLSADDLTEAANKHYARATDALEEADRVQNSTAALYDQTH